MLLMGDIGDPTSITDKFQIQYLSARGHDDDWNEEKIIMEWKENRGKELKQTFPVVVTFDGTVQNDQSKGQSIPPMSNSNIGNVGKINPADQVIFESGVEKGAIHSQSEVSDSNFNVNKGFDKFESAMGGLGKIGDDRDTEIKYLKDEMNQMEGELSKLRGELIKTKTGATDKKGFEMWHICVAMVVAMIIGNFLSSGGST